MHTKFQISTLRNEPNTGDEKSVNAWLQTTPSAPQGALRAPNDALTLNIMLHFSSIQIVHRSRRLLNFQFMDNFHNR